MCLAPNQDRSPDPLYVIHDFARVREDGAPKALGLSLAPSVRSSTHSSSVLVYCGHIEEVISGDTFLLVERVEHFNEPRRKMIRTSALVLVSICAFLYGSLTVISLVLSYWQLVVCAKHA